MRNTTMIKNAIIYQVEMPNANDMFDFAEPFMSVKPDIGQVSTIGFIKHPITKQVVSEFHGGYCLTVQTWTKKIDTSAVAAEVAEMVIHREEMTGEKCNRKEKQAYKENVIARLLPNILPSPKLTFAYFNSLSKTLIIDTGVEGDADKITSLLRKAIGSLKAETLYVDNSIGLTKTVVDRLEDGNRQLIDNVITIDEMIELKGGGSESLKFKGIDLFDSCDEIVAQINEGGMHIKSIDLMYGIMMNFSLTDGFKFKSIKFDSFEIPDGDDDDRDKNHDWLCETVYAVRVITNASTVIINYFTVVED